MNIAEETPTLLSYVHMSKKYNILYVETPKVACSTIKYTLFKAESAKTREPGSRLQTSPFGYSQFLLDIHDAARSPLANPGNLRALNKFLRKATVKFCFIRNPYSRVLSSYIDKIATNEQRRKLFLSSIKTYQGNFSHISFVEFLKLIKDQSPREQNPHWRRQHYQNMFDLIDYDFVGSFEAFNADFTLLFKAKFPEITGSLETIDEHRTDTRTMIRDYYNQDEAIELVREIYRKDFEVLGYSNELSDFDNPPSLRGFQ